MAKAKNLSIGVDLGGTKIAVGLCRDGEILKKVIFPTHAAAGFDGVISVILGAIEKVMEGQNHKDILGLGIGSAGQINAATGEVIYSPNLNWRNAPLGNTIAKAIDLKVQVLNDVRAATLAELKFGNGKGLDSFANVFVGTGIGSGFVINGKLINGATNSAGEVGHTCLDPEGPLCGCGNKGCLEAFASGTGMENYVKAELKKGRKSIIKDLVENRIDHVRGPIIAKAAEQGDELALAAIERVGFYLGISLANIHTMLNPEIILLGGGMMALKKYFMPILLSTMQTHILPVARQNRELVGEARFENDAVLLGGSAIFA
ncbi:MAG: ROK family protein [Candidatus Riflebacteria bacterium]|nr:ROK family protein [Candidatus Riflebacteria bacterium]